MQEFQHPELNGVKYREEAQSGHHQSLKTVAFESAMNISEVFYLSRYQRHKHTQVKLEEESGVMGLESWVRRTRNFFSVFQSLRNFFCMLCHPGKLGNEK